MVRGFVQETAWPGVFAASYELALRSSCGPGLRAVLRARVEPYGMATTPRRGKYSGQLLQVGSLPLANNYGGPILFFDSLGVPRAIFCSVHGLQYVAYGLICTFGIDGKQNPMWYCSTTSKKLNIRCIYIEALITTSSRHLVMVNVRLTRIYIPDSGSALVRY